MQYMNESKHIGPNESKHMKLSAPILNNRHGLLPALGSVEEHVLLHQLVSVDIRKHLWDLLRHELREVLHAWISFRCEIAFASGDILARSQALE